MVDDVLLNKVAIVERCLLRIETEYLGHEDEFATNYTRQDSIILNLQRVCEASIDIAMHLVRIHKLGIPQESREVFDMLAENGMLEPDLRDRLKAMVGFRNIAVHDYRKLNLEIVRNVVTMHLGDFRNFTSAVLRLENP